MRPICFLSDFGLSDDFAGTCKGVIARIAPQATVIDLTHDVPDFDIVFGAETLAHATHYMPEDTVYMAVVDPGVGTQRRGVALCSHNGALLVGPDNGLLIPAAQELGGVKTAVSLTDTDYHLHPTSATFHGRDIFSPAAAHLSAGLPLLRLGKEIPASSLTKIEMPTSTLHPDGSVQATIMDIDRYGNARLSIVEDEKSLLQSGPYLLKTHEGELPLRRAKTFGEARPGELLLVPDSHRRLSLSINGGHAARALMLQRGDTVTITPTT